MAGQISHNQCNRDRSLREKVIGFVFVAHCPLAPVHGSHNDGVRRALKQLAITSWDITGARSWRFHQIRFRPVDFVSGANQTHLIRCELRAQSGKRISLFLRLGLPLKCHIWTRSSRLIRLFVARGWSSTPSDELPTNGSIL
jgi:hypothetical protein